MQLGPAIQWRLDHIFLTRVSSETASGLPGLLLTLSNSGDTGMAVNLWGPSGLNFLVDAMRTFIPHSSVVHAHSFGDQMPASPSGSPTAGDSNIIPESATLLLLDDEVVKISAVLVRPGPGQPAAWINLEERQVLESPLKDETQEGLSKCTFFRGSGTRASAAKSEGSSLLFAEPWELGFEKKITMDLPGVQKRPRLELPLVTKSQLEDNRSTPGTKSLARPGKENPNLSEGTHEPHEVAVVYICELPDIIGKFDPEKAKAKGLQPGPKYGQLQAGKSVKTDDGKNMVYPSDVMDPSSPGPICLVVDCPTVSHVLSLISAPSLEQFSPKLAMGPTKLSWKKVTCMIHIGPATVMNCSPYQEWMAQFEGTQHLMAGHGMLNKVSPILKSSARVMARLNFICPQVFPIAGLQQIDEAMDICEPTSTALITTAENLLKFRLRPISAFPFDRSLVPEPLDISAVRLELVAENPELQEASKQVAELWNAKSRQLGSFTVDYRQSLGLDPHESPSNSYKKKPAWVGKESVKLVDNSLSPASGRSAGDAVDIGLVEELPDCLIEVGREEMEIVFLGTGSSQPSKYRNVSAIYIHLFKRGGLLLDCGEGTYAQLKRRYGNKAADQIVAGLKCVWISHIHADHHTGLSRILSIRKILLEKQGKFEPVLVVGPKQLKRYLDAYGRLEELGMEFLDCSQTTSYADSAALVMNGKDSVVGGSPGSGPQGNLGTSGGTDSNGTIVKDPAGLIRLCSPRKSLNMDGNQTIRGQLRNYWLQSGFNFQAGLDEEGREKLKNTLSVLGLAHLISVPVVHCPHSFGVVLVARGKKLLQPGWKLVYSGDTRPCQTLVEASKGATVLIHEATFDDAMPEEAISKNHSLTREAIETGISAGAYRTILTHFSQRYPKIPVFNESYNHRTCIAFDMMSANLADLPLLPKLLPALKLLFKNDMIPVDEGGEDFIDQS